MIVTNCKIFTPSEDASSRVIRRMSASLSKSFEHIFEQSRHFLLIDESQEKELLSRLQNGNRESPALYALHFLLIDQISRDDLVSSQSTINRILNISPVDPGSAIMELGSSATPVELPTIIPFLAASEDARFKFIEPNPFSAQKCRQQITDSLAMLQNAAQPFYSEISELVPWIVIVASEPTPLNDDAGSSFGGASALRAFGAVLQNSDLQDSVFDRALSLVHETSHHMLFAHSPKDGVVQNSFNDLYSSPLRADPRPMEGIFHATFVLGRIAMVAKCLLEFKGLNSKECELAIETIRESKLLFADGMETLDSHAVFTPPGAFAIEEARTFMLSL